MSNFVSQLASSRETLQNRGKRGKNKHKISLSKKDLPLHLLASSCVDSVPRIFLYIKQTPCLGTPCNVIRYMALLVDNNILGLLCVIGIYVVINQAQVLK